MPRYRVRGIIYQREPNPWPMILLIVIGLIVLGAAIG